MTTRLNRTIGISGHDHWQATMIMTVRISKATAVKDHRVIKQRSFSFLDGLQLAKKVCKLRRQKLINLLQLADILFLVPMVRQPEVATINAYHGIGSITAGVPQHKGGNSRRIRLECEHHQVVHQANVLTDVTRNTLWRHKFRTLLLAGLLGSHHTFLELSDAIEILVDFLTICFT